MLNDGIIRVKRSPATLQHDTVQGRIQSNYILNGEWPHGHVAKTFAPKGGW